MTYVSSHNSLCLAYVYVPTLDHSTVCFLNPSEAHENSIPPTSHLGYFPGPATHCLLSSGLYQAISPYWMIITTRYWVSGTWRLWVSRYLEWESCFFRSRLSRHCNKQTTVARTNVKVYSLESKMPLIYAVFETERSWWYKFLAHIKV